MSLEGASGILNNINFSNVMYGVAIRMGHGSNNGWHISKPHEGHTTTCVTVAYGFKMATAASELGKRDVDGGHILHTLLGRISDESANPEELEPTSLVKVRMPQLGPITVAQYVHHLSRPFKAV